MARRLHRRVDGIRVEQRASSQGTQYATVRSAGKACGPRGGDQHRRRRAHRRLRPVRRPKDERSCDMRGNRNTLIVVTLLATRGVVSATAPTADLPEHTIMRAAGPIAIDGRIDEPSWGAAAAVGDFVFPWWVAGDKEQTEARLLWDDVNLYISFVAEDGHISAIHTDRDAAVSQDDCVEVFIMPDTTHIRHYYNFEVNVLGTILDRFQLSEPTGAYTSQLATATQIDGTLNDESDEDTGFVTEIAIPFGSFIDTAPNVPPKPGDTWRLNLYRIGGRVNAQYSQWSNTG
ncbi:MAG TPA: hypothetical protein EYQ27_00070, partial [Gemmatimonadetes bacterium]|nr:hypothetical protein [Gemmatimonadota bacterium]